MLRAKVRGLARFASRKSEQAEDVGFASGECDAGALASLGAALDVAFCAPSGIPLGFRDLEFPAAGGYGLPWFGALGNVGALGLSALA